MDTDENILAMYAENGQLTRTYLDWRLRVISMYFTSLGAIFISAGWLFNVGPLKTYVWVPFIFGSLTSLLFFLWNETISKVLRITIQVGSELERRLATVPGCHTQVAIWLSRGPRKYLSSAFIWRFVFVISVPSFIAIAVLSTRL